MRRCFSGLEPNSGFGACWGNYNYKQTPKYLKQTQASGQHGLLMSVF